MKLETPWMVKCCGEGEVGCGMVRPVGEPIGEAWFCTGVIRSCYDLAGSYRFKVVFSSTPVRGAERAPYIDCTEVEDLADSKGFPSGVEDPVWWWIEVDCE
jgi:hypothetical protein